MPIQSVTNFETLTAAFEHAKSLDADQCIRVLIIPADMKYDPEIKADHVVHVKELMKPHWYMVTKGNLEGDL